MKCVKHTICLIAITLLLAGCGQTGLMTVGSLTEQGDNIVKLGGTISDTSVQKEALVHQTLQNRDKLQSTMYKGSGFQMEFAMVDVNGSKVYLPKKIQYREAPRFTQRLPTAPSVHPLWGTVNKGISALLTGFGIYTAADVMKYSYDRTAPAYGGDYVSNSYNPSTVTTGVEVLP